MKCSNHPQTEALAICIHCGAGVCAECVEKTPTNRMVCSPECAKSLAESEAILGSIRRKTLGGHRLTGYFCYGAAAILLVFSTLALLNRQWDLLMLQLPVALGLAISGFFYLRLANRIEP